MKNFLAIFFLVTSYCSVNAQQYFEFPKSSIFCDVPGSTFLVATYSDTKIFIEELNADGSSVWVDSTDIITTGEYFYFNSFVPYGNTDDYVLITQRDLNFPITLNDSAIYQFIKVSTNSNAIVQTKVDTITAIEITAMEYNDTAVYLFKDLYFPSGEPFRTETIELDNNLEISLVASPDSISGYYYGGNYFEQNDTIYLMQELSDEITSYVFTNSISAISSAVFTEPCSQDHQSIRYANVKGHDSVFVFSECYSSGNPIKDWTFAWLKPNFDEILVQNYSAPNNYFNTVGSPAVIVDESRIYVMAIGEILGQELRTIFVYDFSFNLICEIPISENFLYTEELILINNRPYFSRENSTKREYYEIGDCEFVLSNSTDFSEDLKATIYPNPANNLLNVMLENNLATTIEIIDLAGNFILSQSLTQLQNSIDISSLTCGIYIIRLTNSEGVLTKKITKI